MYASVPATIPGAVSDCGATVVTSASASSVSRFASPKSSTLTCPSGVTTTFPLLKSRWTTPRACACASASASCWPYRTTWSVGSGPSATRALSGCPSTSSIAM